MGKRRTVWSYRKLVSWQKEGRGQGDYDEYKPWLTIHDFPSNGKVCRIMGHTVPRLYHFMSQLERDLFIILDHRPEVTDIKEQYPLSLAHTQLIASSKGIRHPEVNGFPYVMTTDLFYQEAGTWHAVQVKHSSALNDERVLEKFEIEKAYYEMINVDWRVETEKTISRVMADNYQWLYAGADVRKLVSPDMLSFLIEHFLNLYDTELPFRFIIRNIEEEFCLRDGTVLSLFKYLVINKIVDIDLTAEINPMEPRGLAYA